MAQCKHDEKDCKNFDAAEPKAQELPEIEGYEITTAGELNDGETGLLRMTRKNHCVDNDYSVSFNDPSRDPTWIGNATPCYRLKPGKIRADEVPDLRKFKDAQGRIHRRVVSAGDGRGGDSTICAPIIDGSTWGSWIKPDTLVTLLPEDRCII